MITFNLRGDLKKTQNFFKDAVTRFPQKLEMIFHKYGMMGVTALQRYTPRDSGETASSWNYKVQKNGIIWTNSNDVGTDAPLAILLQYGHGTKNGGYVQGIDYINPALKPIFDQISNNIRKEVQNL